MQIKGGTKDVRRAAVAFPVMSATWVTLDGAAASLAAVRPGQRVQLNGTRLGTTYSVGQVMARNPTPATPPAPEPTPEV